jgi:hypothetical protein
VEQLFDLVGAIRDRLREGSSRMHRIAFVGSGFLLANGDSFRNG